MNKDQLELYSDYLISSFSQTTATGLSTLLDQSISHDQVTRFLSGGDYGSRELWQLVKAVVRREERDDGVLIFDDTIQEKPSTDENEIITWHYDHSKNRTVKGVNIVNALYHVNGVNIPVAFEPVVKDHLYSELKTRKVKRRSEVTKNEQLRSILKVCHQNELKYRYVLTDSWFASSENMLVIKQDLKKDFIMALKANRTVALSTEDRAQGRFIRIDELALEPGTVKQVYLKGVEFPVRVAKQLFKHKDKNDGILYLVSSDLSLDYDTLTTTYQKRWEVEVFHKSIKQNTGLAKSPTRRVRTQSNHFFASIYACFKLEQLKLKHQINHFALRSKLYMKALLASFQQLQALTGQVAQVPPATKAATA